MGRWLEGKTLADKVKERVAEDIARLKGKSGKVPGLVAILVGDDRASQVYLRSKEKTSQRLGISSRILTFPKNMSAEELRRRVEELNKEEDVDGILIQLPLPSHLNPYQAISWIRPDKDVDGFHPFSLGSLLWNQDGLAPCTPLGIVELLKDNNVALKGQEVVVVGRSLIVGKPLAAMLTNEHCTVTLCHSRTKDLPLVATRADILVAALGKAAFVTPEFVKPGAVVIDVGINSLSEAERVKALFGDDAKRERDLADKGYTIVGDVHPAAIEKASLLTPVPGGVGLLTVAMLMQNTLDAFKRRKALV